MFKKLVRGKEQIFLRKMSVVARSIKYEKYGEPVDVLNIVEETLSTPRNRQVLLEILAAPINPVDINTIQGKYPVKPQFPAIAGNECVAKVLEVGEEVRGLSPGQHVVPFEFGLGTWRTHALLDESKLLPISNKIGLAEAATITINPCTAYRMLKDFIQLKPGDCIIQNGANSAAGQAIHQLCKAWNLKSIGVVRDRKEINVLKDFLKNMGATEVLTEDEIRTTTIFKDEIVQKPCLAFDCIGGKSATEIARQLDHDGIMVTYGGMSRDPVIIPTAALIFKNISFCGFRIGTWSENNVNSNERKHMFAELCKLMEEGKFVGPVHEFVPLEDFKTAAAATLNFKGFTGKKFILDMHDLAKFNST